MQQRSHRGRNRMFRRVAAPIACLTLWLWPGAPARAETFIEHSAEAQMQLDFHVPDAALAAMLPAGWEPNVATAGPAKDANLRMIFIDRVDITGPDGKPLGRGSNHLVYLAIPIKQPSTGTVGQMIIGGITADPADAPGPFGAYLPASVHRMERARSEEHTSELQSLAYLVCRLLLEKKKNPRRPPTNQNNKKTKHEMTNNTTQT